MKSTETADSIKASAGSYPDEVESILEDIGEEPDLQNRINLISKRFLGRPYVEGALGGGPGLSEQLTISLSAYDCVTYMEVVLALARARTQEEFVENLRLIRYQHGEIDWLHRNHYMVDWAGNNVAAGFIVNLTVGNETVEKTRVLSLVPGLPEKTATFSCFPPHYSATDGGASTGDLIFFVSTKETLDVFHTGLVVVHDGICSLRHATRTAGEVVEQKLDEFMSQNQLSGFILLRPLCRP